jgi:hypothetical protein
VIKPNFPPHFWHELAASNPMGRRDVTAQDARDWFDFTWPVYKNYRTRTRCPNHKLRLNQWWHRINDAELDRARAFGAEQRRSTHAEELQKAATLTFASHTVAPLSPRTDLPPLRISRGRANG